MPGSASPFEASRDIHTIAENVIVVDDVVTLVDADGNAMRRLAETAVFCSVAPCWTATRVNDASKLDQEAVAGYSLSGRVLFGLRVDHFAEEGLETFETATDRAASVAPLHALSSGPIIPLGVQNRLALVGEESVSGVTAELPPGQTGTPTHAHLYHRQ